MAFSLRDSHRLIKALKRRYQPKFTAHEPGVRLSADGLPARKPTCEGAQSHGVGLWLGSQLRFLCPPLWIQVTAVDLDPAVFPYVDVFAEINSVQLTNKCSDLPG